MSPLLVIVIQGECKHYDFLAQRAIAASNVADRRGMPLLVMEKRGFCQKGMRLQDSQVVAPGMLYGQFYMPGSVGV